MMKGMQRVDLGIDLGTSKFSLCSRSEGILCNEPAYIAVQNLPKGRSRVIAVGREAEAMAGKSPAQIEVCCPMRQGVIVQPKLASLLLQHLLKQVGLQNFMQRRRRLLVGTIWGASQLEQKTFVDVAASIGAASVKAIKEPLAAAIGSRLEIDDSHGHILLDVGSGASEVIIIASSRIVMGRSIRIGGQSMDLAIMNLIAKKHDIIISEATARSAKEKLKVDAGPNEALMLSGYHVRQRQPCEVKVSVLDLLATLRPAVDRIVGMVADLLSEIPPELAVDVIDGGLFVSGGGALSISLREELERRTQLDVHIVSQPTEAVVRGCQAVLRYYDLVS